MRNEDRILFGMKATFKVVHKALQYNYKRVYHGPVSRYYKVYDKCYGNTLASNVVY